MVEGRRYMITQGEVHLCHVSCPNNHITQVRKFKTPDEDGLCVSGCSTSEFIVESVFFKFPDDSSKTYCLSSCNEEPYLFDFPYNGANYCTNSCRTENSTTFIIPNIRYFYEHGTRKTCVSKCPSTHSFLNTPSNYNLSTEFAECITTCDSDRFETAYPSLLYYDETPKKYCTDSCWLSNFFFFYESDKVKKCIDTCISPFTGDNRYLRISDFGLWECVDKCPAMIKNTKEFNTLGEHGLCKDKCSGFTLTSNSFVWKDKKAKTYCVDNCTQLTNTHIYYNEDRKCVVNCQEAGIKFTMEDRSCSDNCLLFILDNIYCVAKCPSNKPLVEEQNCTDRCSINNPFIEKFRDCTNTCPNLKYEDICTDSCDNLYIPQYLASIGRIAVPKPFISSKRECLERCSEQAFPLVNSITNECINSCPPKCKGDECLYNNLIYTDEDLFCRENCKESNYPLTDNTLMRCFSHCTPERPYIFEQECLDICPVTHLLVTRRPRCENAACNSNCEKFSQYCSSKCPEDYKLQLLSEGIKYCVCQCPAFYKVDGINCVLFCDPRLGFVPNLTKTSCNHCFRDNKAFFYNNSCVPSCPSKTIPNEHYVCTPCFDLNLWTNDEGRCILRSQCDILAYFNEAEKICSLCIGDDLIITKRGSIYKCERNDCKDGFISKTLSKPVCVFCAPSQFFQDPECKGSCFKQFSYDFHNKTCLLCPNTCSCCDKGKCRANTCICQNGWTGKYCNTPSSSSEEVSRKIMSFLNAKLSSIFFENNENELIFELSIIIKQIKRQLTLNPAEIQGFIDRIFTFIKKQHVKHAYQPTLLSTLDNLIQLAVSNFELTGNRKRLDQIVEFLYEITNDIQMFNITMSVVPEFKKISQAVFKGVGFNLSFGPDVTVEKQLEMTTCLNKIKNNLSLSSDHKFPYRLVTLKPSLKTIKIEENVFVASTSPFTMMLSLYNEKGLINIEKQCEERFIDLSYEVEVEDEEVFQRINKLKTSETNIFDKKDPFFNDRCIPFSDGKDVTLAKRKEEIFVDPSSLCEESVNRICEIKETSEEGKVKCFCRGIQNKKKSTLESTFATYPKSNYILVTCFSIFKNAILDQNIGFYTISIPCLIVVLLIYYCNWKIDEDLTDKRRFQYMRTDLCVFDPTRMDKEVYFDECFNLETRINVMILEIKGFDDENKDSLDFDFTSLPSLPDLALLSLEDSLRLDQRTNIQFAKDTFLYENSLYYALFSKSTLEPKPFVLLLFVTELNLNITLNCFFIDDDMVDNSNENKGISLWNSLSNELVKTIWALVTSKLLTWVLNVFYSFKERQSNLLKKRLLLTKDNSAVKAYNLFLTEHTGRLLILIVAIVVFNLFCIYFVVIYNEIYTQSSEIWLNGIFMGLVMDILVIQGIIPALLIITRYLAKRSENYTLLYKIAAGLNTIKNLSFIN